ncbi:hypothetical protein GGI23_003710, partial [Coemansia sp. RSA 2559]
MNQVRDIVEVIVAANISSSRESKPNTVWLSPDLMQSQGMFAGDVVQIYTICDKGAGPVAYASVWPSSSVGDKICIPEPIQLNCRVNIGDRVRIERTSYVPEVARAVRICYSTKVNGADLFAEALVKKKLSDVKYVYLGQYIDISIGGMPCRMCIESVEPNQGRTLVSMKGCAEFSFERTSVSISG